MSKRALNVIVTEAKAHGIDFATTPDGKAAQFLFFGKEEDLAAFESSIAQIQQAAKLPDSYTELVSSDLNETDTNFSSKTGRRESQAWLQTTPEGLALLERVARDLIAPYAKAIGSEGYRVNIDLFAKRFGLTPEQTEILADALYPKHGRHKSADAWAMANRWP